MNHFNYTPNVTGLRTLKTEKEQNENFFYDGHPVFLIPDFSTQPGDIWLIYMDFLEKDMDCEIWDQDGGEITSHSIMDANTGLTKCTYTAYGLMLDEDEDPQDVDVEIEGFIVETVNQGFQFWATKVFEQYKNSI